MSRVFTTPAAQRLKQWDNATVNTYIHTLFGQPNNRPTTPIADRIAEGERILNWFTSPVRTHLADQATNEQAKGSAA